MIFILLAAGVAGSFLSLKFLPGPFVWIALVWVVVLALIARKSKRSAIRIGSAYLAAAVFAFGVAEAYLWSEDTGAQLNIRSLAAEKYIIPDDVLGYRPSPNNQGHAVKEANGARLYDVIYSIDSSGLRIAPPHDPDASEAILFMGCSITFGEGLPDSSTSSFQTGLALHGKDAVYNFGFHGYGPHQILARLQRGNISSVVKEKPKYAIYQAITGHIPRVLGLTPWNEHDPRFLGGADGKLEYAGHFDGASGLSPRLKKYLNKCLVYRNLRLQSVNDSDVTLFIDLVDECRIVFEQQYSGSEFHIIYWNEERDAMGDRVVAELRKRGARVHLIGEVIPDFSIEKHLIPQDRHPNAVANAAIAKFVSEQIVRLPAESKDSKGSAMMGE